MGAAGMNGGERPTVASIGGVQQRQGFRATNFTHDDAVRVMPEDGSEHIVEGDPAVMCVGLRLGGDDVGFADVQLSSVLDEQYAFVVRDGVSPMPATYCYLKPDFLPIIMNWFEQEKIDFDPERITA